MQPRNLLPAAAALVVLDAGAELGAVDALDEVAALAAGGVVLVALDVLLPHAAINTVAAPTATVTANLVRLTVSSRGKKSLAPGMTRAPTKVRLPGDYFVGVSEGRGFADFSALVAKLRREPAGISRFPRAKRAPAPTNSPTFARLSRIVRDCHRLSELPECRTWRTVVSMKIESREVRCRTSYR
jgi:hypothetical protein